MILHDFTLFYNFMACPGFLDIKQTLHYKVVME